MKRFLFLSIGFEQPTKEMMESWGQWHESIKDKIIDNGHFGPGTEYSKDNSKALHMDTQAITGYMIFEAEDSAEAEEVAKSWPVISSNRLYEIMEAC